MTHLRPYIDACETFGWSGGQEFNTRLVTLLNGRERRNANWSQGRHRYTLPFQNLMREQYRAVRQMHEVCRACCTRSCTRHHSGERAGRPIRYSGIGDGRARPSMCPL